MIFNLFIILFSGLSGSGNFKEFHLDLTTLSDYDNLLEQALDTNFIATKQLGALKDWRENPAEWNGN